MYFTFRDTQQCISNNKIIIAKVAIEWNRKLNQISTKSRKTGNDAYKMWITPVIFVGKDVKTQEV